jgi:hypothetical protein
MTNLLAFLEAPSLPPDSTRGKRSRRIGWLLVICLLFGMQWARAEEETSSKKLARHKAVFMYNFIEYVKWPEGKRDGPFVINMLGECEVVSTMKAVARKRRAGDRAMVVKSIASVEEIEPACHMLFIAPAQGEQMKKIDAKVHERNILTVGDSPGLTEKGVIINFVSVGPKLRFKINLEAAEAADLRLSSHLLKLGILAE